MSENEFSSYIVETLSPLGDVYAKRMFGGEGIFCGTLMFGIIADDELYLKVDDELQQEYEEIGCEPFTYMKKNKEYRMSYYHAPADALDNPSELLEWGEKSYQSAVRADRKKRSKKKV